MSYTKPMVTIELQEYLELTTPKEGESNESLALEVLCAIVNHSDVITFDGLKLEHELYNKKISFAVINGTKGNITKDQLHIKRL